MRAPKFELLSILAALAVVSACKRAEVAEETPPSPPAEQAQQVDDEAAFDGHVEGEHAAPEEPSAPAEPGAAHDHGGHEDVVAQPGASVGDAVRCPVAGTAFTVTADTAHLDTPEGRVYFSQPEYLRTYQRDPAAYPLRAAPEPTGPVEVSATGTNFDPPVAKDRIPEGAWFCDMGTVHYARMEEGDGRCPRCGMRLVQ